MRKISFFVLFILISFNNYAQYKTNSPHFSDVKYEIDNDIVTINYKVNSYHPKDKLYVWIENNGNSILQNDISGNYGSLSPGIHQLKCNLNKIENRGTGKTTISLFATVYPFAPNGKALGMSLLYPGTGSRMLNPSKKNQWIGIAAYGLLASSVALNFMANKDYADYKKSSSSSEADNLFNGAKNKRNLAIGLVAGAGAIWTIDITNTVLKYRKASRPPLRISPPDQSERKRITYNLDINKHNDNVAPVITLNFDRGLKPVVNEKFLNLSGIVTDDSKIIKVSVNNKSVELSAENTFSIKQALAIGENAITIEAVDFYNNIGVKTINVKRESSVSVVDQSLSDKNPAIIEIISPNIDLDEIQQTSERYLTVKGKAIDKDGVFDISVNGIEAMMLADGSFTGQVPLAIGENSITIKVTDIKQQTSSKIFKIQRVDKTSTNSIVWNTPVKKYFETESSQININACIGTFSNIQYYSIFVNDQLVEKFYKQSLRFRNNCKFGIEKTIDLQFGENIIKISATTDDGVLESERIVNYKLNEKNYYALLIAVEQYDNEGINDLTEPVNDTEALKQVLVNNYTFKEENIMILKNSTRSEIIGTLHKLRTTIGSDDNLLVFYAGHGHWDAGMKTGYWLPRDAEPENPANWLSNGDLTGYLNAIKSKHTLLIADACFSGGIFKTRSAFNTKKALEKLYKMSSRKAMTSGTLKEVPDKSVFLEYLIKHLKQNTEDYITAEQLFSEFRMNVINNSPNVPQYGTIQNTGDEGGEFIFIRKK